MYTSWKIKISLMSTIMFVFFICIQSYPNLTNGPGTSPAFLFWKFYIFFLWNRPCLIPKKKRFFCWYFNLFLLLTAEPAWTQTNFKQTSFVLFPFHRTKNGKLLFISFNAIGFIFLFLVQNVFLSEYWIIVSLAYSSFNPIQPWLFGAPYVW